jgi:hypothetical protein
MFYVIPDILLKGTLNTNKTGHHDILYTCHIVESGVKHPNPSLDIRTLIILRGGWQLINYLWIFEVIFIKF